MAYTQSAVAPIIYIHSNRTRYFVPGLLVLTCIVLLIANIAPPSILAEGNSNNVMAAACVTGAATFVPPGAKVTPATTVPCKTQIPVPSKTATPAQNSQKFPTATQPSAIHNNAAIPGPAPQACQFPMPVAINYTDFSDMSSICMLGNASQFSRSRLRLTTTLSTGQSGAAWYASPLNVGGGFTTTFDFLLSNPSTNPGADGFAFVIQGASIDQIGTGGCGMGFGGQDGSGNPAGIPDSLAVQFDTFQNGGSSQYCNNYNDPSANYIAVQSGGIGPNTANHTITVGNPPMSAELGETHSTSLPQFTDGQPHKVVIVYIPALPNTPTPTAVSATPSITSTVDPLFPTLTPDLSTATITTTPSITPTGLPTCQGTPGMLSICVDGGAPVLSVTVDLSKTLALTNGLAYVGFTAGTGLYTQNHDILDWQLTTNSYSATLTPTPSMTPTTTLTPSLTATPDCAQYGISFSGFQSNGNANFQVVNANYIQSRPYLTALVGHLACTLPAIGCRMVSDKYA